MTSRAAALAGAIAYVAWLLVFGGVAGQSPVFFNLPMATAAVLVAGGIAREDDRLLTWRGCLAMLLTGLAMQIKYSVVFEGIFFGLSLLWLGRVRGRNFARLAGDAIVWIACALAPTMAAFLYYHALGHGEDFIQANFLSILSDSVAFLPALARLAALIPGLAPLWLCAWIVWRRQGGWPRPERAMARWTLAWCAASLGGILAFGLWFDHYMLPLLVPLCLLAALAFGAIERRWRLIVLVLGLGIAGGLGRAVVEYRINGDRAQIEQLAALVKPRLGTGCLYVKDEHAILYNMVDSCLPTRYIFPQHLALNRYANGLGVGQVDELRRVLDSRPSVIVFDLTPDDDTTGQSRAMLAAVLARQYALAGVSRVGTDFYAVYALRDGGAAGSGRAAQ